MPILNKDMTLCISLAARPSNIGTRFHNYLYDELGLNFIYKAFTTNNIEDAIAGVRGLGIRGCSVSMPFKEAVLELVDVVEHSAAAIESVNTIVNNDGVLTASNTDYEAVANLIARHELDPSVSVLVRGSGGMAKAVVAAFHGAGFADVTVLARNVEAGEAIATKYGYRAVSVDPQPGHAVLVNVTPLGMAGDAAEELAFTPEHIRAAQTVFDVVAFPADPSGAGCRKICHHGCRSHRTPGRDAIRSLHRRHADARPDRTCFGVLAGVVARSVTDPLQASLVDGLFSYYIKHMSIGESVNGVPVTEEQIAAWAAEAEAGYDVAKLKERGRGRPGRGAEPSQVVALRLTPDELAALDARAAREHKTRSEAIRDALTSYVA